MNVVSLLVQKLNAQFSLSEEGTYEKVLIDYENKKLLIARPRVSMNNSGIAVRDILRNNQILIDNICIVHDDIDLPFGRLRLKNESSDGGHNGVKSIVNEVGTDSFFRLKLGLGRPKKGVDPASFVLSKFNKGEEEEIDFLIDDSTEVLLAFIKDKKNAVKKASERRIIDVV
tara:strand:+ start:981 stop:1496 length:516 start_codon:yes stop_codon:yes gene_type:complete